jgi:purine nucleosidase
MSPRAIILDCDPGQDDAVAILMALGAPEAIELLAVTTVAGNVPLARTHANARRVLELAGRTDMPVHAGCERPILRAPVTAEAVHGETGLDGAGLPEPTMALARGHAVDVIVETLMSRPPGAVTLCPTGPLTNIALAIVKEPGIVPRIREIVLMGGAIGLGNVTPSAEFNLFADPHAARIVFEADAPIVMFPLDVTHQVIVTAARRDSLAALDSPVSRAVVGMMDFYGAGKVRFGLEGAPLHDPCVIAWLIRPELFRGRACRVDIETDSPLGLGRSVVDWWARSGRAPNATVMREADAEGFFALLIACLARPSRKGG